MTEQTGRVACYLAKDLLIPYAAAEVSEPTRAWVDQHLAACNDCREAFAGAGVLGGPSLPVAPAPPPAAEQRLLLRMRRTLRVILGVIVGLALAVAGLGWSIGQVRKLADFPDVHPVPAASMPAREAVQLDLSPLRLTRTAVTEARVETAGFIDGAVARFETADRQQVSVWAYRFDGSRQATSFAESWKKQFKVQMMSVAIEARERSVAKFRSGGTYYYDWSTDGWFIVIGVPDDVREPLLLRDQIRDLIFMAYAPA